MRRQRELAETDDFPRQLARLRKDHGWTLDELSQRVNYNRSYLHKLESGERTGSADAARSLDATYGARGLLYDSWRKYKRGAYLGRFQEFMALEERATIMEKYSAAVIPGLFQTEAYARAQLSLARLADPQHITEQVEARIARQELLKQDNPPDVRMILDESALLRPLPGHDDWVAQLVHLLDIARLPNVTLQVLPFSAGLQWLLGGSLTILWTPDGRSVAYEESSTNGNLIEETSEVQDLRRDYDRLRDDSLTPRESAEHLTLLLEETRHAPPQGSQSE